MSVSAKVIIAGQNNISSAVKGARNDLSTLAQASQKVGDTLKKAFTVTAIVASLKKLGSVCVDCFNDFSTATRSYKQLSLDLKDNSGSTREFTRTRNTRKKELKKSKQFLLSFLLRVGKTYPDNGNYWTKKHWDCLGTLKFNDTYLDYSLQAYIQDIKDIETKIEMMDKIIEEIAFIHLTYLWFLL